MADVGVTGSRGEMEGANVTGDERSVCSGGIAARTGAEDDGEQKYPAAEPVHRKPPSRFVGRQRSFLKPVPGRFRAPARGGLEP
jgi:hypothetical protein